jgi:peptidoglycan/xylan/chitin deacetylase (PgdA/CDA1 family)
MRISFILILVLAFNLSCQQKSGKAGQGGLAISFDDHFIDEWYALRPLFQKYNAKVTFFVVCGDTLTQDEVSKLKQLQDDGHEIGFHGTVHGRSTNIIAAHGPEKYAQEELVPGIAYMKAAGFNTTSYAHPGGNHNDQVDSVLFAHGFIILRDVAIANRVYKGIPLYSIAPRVMNSIYYKFDKEQKVDALLIDNDSGLDEDDLKEAVQRAKDTDTALMLFGHKPLTGAQKPGDYGFDVAFLEQILKAAQASQMKYYTMSELPKL